MNEQAIAKALDDADESHEVWEATLQRLRVFSLADANNLLWVRMGRACPLRHQGRKRDTPRISTLQTGLTHLIPLLYISQELVRLEQGLEQAADPFCRTLKLIIVRPPPTPIQLVSGSWVP